MAPNTHCSLFLIHHFVYTYAHNLETTSHIWTFCCTYWTTALLWMSIFWVRTACEIRLASYGPKHALQSLSDMPFVRTYMYNLKLWVVYGHFTYQTTALLSEIFLTWFRIVWQIWLESYSCWHALRSFSGATLCAYTARLYVHVYMYIASWCITMDDNNKTHILHQTMALLPTMHCFIRTKCYIAAYELLQSIASAYTLQCLPVTVNAINTCTLIL